MTSIIYNFLTELGENKYAETKLATTEEKAVTQKVRLRDDTALFKVV
jgi:hypothetical protein